MDLDINIAMQELDSRDDWDSLLRTQIPTPEGFMTLNGYAVPYEAVPYRVEEGEVDGREFFYRNLNIFVEDGFSFARLPQGQRRRLSEEVIYRFAERSAVELARSPEAIPYLVEALSDFRTPVYGSPPHGFTSVSDLLGKGAQVAALGGLIHTGHPVLTVVSATGLGVYWFGRPHARIVRRSLADRLAKALGTTLQDDDLR